MPFNPNASAFVPNISAPIFIPGVPFAAQQTNDASTIQNTDKDNEAMKLLMLDHAGESINSDIVPGKIPTPPSFNARMAEIHSKTPPNGEIMTRNLPRIESGKALDQMKAASDVFDPPMFLVDMLQAKGSGSMSPRDQWTEEQGSERPELIWASQVSLIALTSCQRVKVSVCMS